MPWIGDDDIYPDDPNISLDDRIIGTNGDDPEGKTQQYPLRSIAQLIADYVSANVAGFSQNNIGKLKYLGIVNDVLTTTIAAKVNAAAQFTVDDTDIYHFSVLTDPLSPDPMGRGTGHEYRFRLINVGKGTYGVGGTAITSANIEMLGDFTVSSTTISNMATQTIDFGEIGATAISTYLNSQDPAITIQDQSAGLILIKTLVSGVPTDYLFIGTGGIYGVAETQSTSNDFEALPQVGSQFGVQTVSGDLVDNTDPSNPYVYSVLILGDTGINVDAPDPYVATIQNLGVLSISGNVVDNTDYQNPVITVPDPPVQIPSELEKITEGSNTGWRLLGRDPAKYGDIGSGAVDLSNSNSNSSTKGATGLNAVATGNNTTASGINSRAGGSLTVASGIASRAEGTGNVAQGDNSQADGYGCVAVADYSHAEGYGCRTEGDASFAHGSGNRAQTYGETVLGVNAEDVAGTAGSYSASDPAFRVGVGSDGGGNRKDGLRVIKNGEVLAPALTKSVIDAAGDRVLLTKEWVKDNFAPFVYTSDNYTDDAAAASGGIPVGGLYHTSGTVKIRLT